MPTIRIVMADDLPLITPAHSFRFIETLAPGEFEGFPLAKAFFLYDQGDRGGMRQAYLASSFDTVVENVRADPGFYGRLVVADCVGGKRIGFLAQHFQGLTGNAPPTQEDIDAAEAEVVAAEQAAEGQPAELQAQAARLRELLEVRRGFVGAHCRLDLAIPAGNDELRHYTYWLTQSADEVMTLIEPPPPAPVRPGVAATPIRKPGSRRKAS